MSYQNRDRDSRDKDKMVITTVRDSHDKDQDGLTTVLTFIMGIPLHRKTVYILKQSPVTT